ncbi:MAG: BtpA/SgcQ family protein [Phycisphaeraceae bacterium]
MTNLCTSLFVASQPVIGMLHCPPLPGAPRNTQSIGDIIDFVMRDAATLVEGKVHGLMLENFGDTPFFPGRVPAHTVAHLTAVACEVRRRFDLPLGINVLRNDGCSALAVAQAVGARFIRVNVLCGARVTDQGILQGIAHELLRAPGRKGIAIFADVNVKHSAPVAPIPLEQEVHDLIQRGGADAVIVSGTGTGVATDIEHVKQVKQAATSGGETPVFIGSGITPENIATYRPHCDGFIVGSSLKRGNIDTPIDAKRVGALMQGVR